VYLGTIDSFEIKSKLNLKASMPAGREGRKVMVDKKQIYIVDDDESVCRALKILLVTFGFKVETFPSSEKFFSAVPNNTKGCLVMDIHMPGLDGWEALKCLIKTGSTRPVIIITADKNGGLKEHALKAGAVGFLQKPFNDKALVDLINLAFYKGNVLKYKFLLMEYLITVLALPFFTTSVLGCNMMRGAGKDISNAGESIQRTVDHND